MPSSLGWDSRAGAPFHLNYFTLWNPDFAISMVMGCSGLEGIFFFLFTYCLVKLFGLEKENSLGKSFVVCCAGVTLMLVLNILRISFFFALSLFLERHYANNQGKAFCEWAFHANIGWFLYLAGLIVFFRTLTVIRSKGVFSSAGAEAAS